MKETRFKQTEIGPVPEEWRVVRLGDCASIKTGKRNGDEAIPNGLYPFFVRSQEVYRINSYSYDGEAIIVPGEGNIGSIFHYINGKFDYHQRVYKISDFPKGISAKFLFFMMKRYFGPWALSQTVKATVDSLRLSTFEKFQFPLPPLAEQSRIAGALSSVDGLLSSLSRLIEKKRALRTAAMQQLLTAKTRLPGFDEPWKEVRLGDYFDIGNGYTPSKANPAYWTNGTIPWFRMEDIRTNGRILNDSIQHITPEAVKGSGLFPKGSIILSTTATIGEHALLIADSLANQRFSFLVRKLNRAEEIDIMYFFYQCFALGDWCRENINEGGLAAVNMEDLKNYLISLPILPEQRAIAAVLSSMDSELSSLEAKRSKVEALRTGMMQELLTGRIRLTEEAAERKPKTVGKGPSYGCAKMISVPYMRKTNSQWQ